MISDIMVAIELACRRRDGVRFLHREDLPIPTLSPMRTPRKSIRWQVKLGTGHRVGVIPDRVFGLEFTDSKGKLKRSYYFLEADRGTMPVTRKQVTQTSVARKLSAYEATWTRGLHQAQLGLNRFRVLTVTTSRDRMNMLLRACDSLPRGHGLFLFADIDTLIGHPDPLRMPWSACRKSAQSLLED